MNLPPSKSTNNTTYAYHNVIARSIINDYIAFSQIEINEEMRKLNEE